MTEHFRDVKRRREAGEEVGFTLIELLIVIVVLGILAATVIFALGGVTGQSAQASCNSDAKSVEVAVEAYKASPQNATNAFPTTMAQLTGSGGGGPFLRQAPTNTHYKIFLGDGVTNNADGALAAKGQVLVGSSTAAGIADAHNYDSSNNPCDNSTIVS